MVATKYRLLSLLQLPTASLEVVHRASDGREFTDSLAAWGLVQDADGDQLVVPMVFNLDGLGAFGYLEVGM